MSYIQIDNSSAVRALGTAMALFVLSIAIEVVGRIGLGLTGASLESISHELFLVNFITYGFLIGAGVLYLRYTGYGLSYIDFEPDATDIGYGVIGGVLSIVVIVGIGAITAPLGSGFFEPDALATQMSNDLSLFALFAFVQLVIGAPAKAFFFFNVIQKRLYGSFTRLQAVFLGGTLFFTLVNAWPMLLAVGEVGLFAAGVGFGTAAVHAFVCAFLYERTDNLLTPAASNYVYNMLYFSTFYFFIL